MIGKLETKSAIVLFPCNINVKRSVQMVKKLARSVGHYAVRGPSTSRGVTPVRSQCEWVIANMREKHLFNLGKLLLCT